MTRWLPSILTAVAMGFGAGAASAATTSFSSSYAGASGGSTCGTTYSISGVEPADTAKHPVFLYMVGTTETYNNAQAMAAVNAMAAKGFVAAAIQYNSGTFGTCSDIGAKAACIFKPSSTASAVSKLCSRSRADCSKGIVVAGFSQGSVIATLAKNTDSRVRAAYGMGTHNLYSIYDLSTCMNNGKHALPASNLRIANGENDIFPGGNPIATRTSSQSVTGLNCGSGAYQCLNSNGSGWIMIRGIQVTDLSADHCYQRLTGDCLGLESLVDPKWQSGSGNWALPASLNWLAGFATP